MNNIGRILLSVVKRYSIVNNVYSWNNFFFFNPSLNLMLVEKKYHTLKTR